MNQHLAQLVERAPSLDVCIDDVGQVYAAMRDTVAAGGKILICGNGGSGADAEHWTGELLKGFLTKRPLNAAMREQLGETIASNLQGGIPAIPLTGFLSLRTAWQNDCDPDYVYAQLVYALGKPGDILIGISTSGNSKNVNHALETAGKLGIKTVAMTGAGGGRAAQNAQMAIRVPSNVVHLIQELHLPIYHTLCIMLEEAFFPEGGEAGA